MEIHADKKFDVVSSCSEEVAVAAVGEADAVSAAAAAAVVVVVVAAVVELFVGF